jgi:hypothetical protein
MVIKLGKTWKKHGLVLQYAYLKYDFRKESMERKGGYLR